MRLRGRFGQRGDASWRRAVICWVFAVAVGASCARPHVPATPREMRVLVYNVHAGKDAAGRDNLSRVADLVREVRADVVLLQEVDRYTRRSGQVDQPDTLARRTGFAVAFGKTLDYDGGEYGIATLSRWPITHQTLTRLPVEPPQRRSGGSYEPRGAQRVTVRVPGADLTLVNTHLDASRDDHYRRQEIRTVLAIARDAAPLVLVGGDLNSTPDSEVQAEVRTGGLRDAWLECGHGDGFTYPADAPTKRIDYLYLTGSATCASAIVLETAASDHRPLLVTVRMK
ncbi:MAG: endonuclease/exonuclease/phosphatase family protein [Gemmatimonadaceae bacterium]